MALDSGSQANNSGAQTDSPLQRAASDLQAGQLNNPAFYKDINDLLTQDQGQQAQISADLLALNQQLQAKKILPGLVLVGEDGNGNVIYDDPENQQIKMIGTNNGVVDSGSEQDMLAKYSSQQNQSGNGDQVASASDQNSAQAPSDVQDQSLAQSQSGGQDQSNAKAQSDSQDQSHVPPKGDGQGQDAPSASKAGQAETWGQHGRQYSPTPGQDGEYTHVVEQFQGDDKPGDTMDRIAADSLDKQHDNDPNYQPSDQAVAAEVQRIAAYNADSGTVGQPPEYTIRVGDTIKIPPKDWTAPGAGGEGEGTGSANQGASHSVADAKTPAAIDKPAPSPPPADKNPLKDGNPLATSNSLATSDSVATSDESAPSNSAATMDSPASKDAPPPSYTQAPSDAPPYGYTQSASDGQPSSYTQAPSDVPPYGYTQDSGYAPSSTNGATTSDAPPYGYTPAGSGPPPYEYPPAVPGPNAYAYNQGGYEPPPYNNPPPTYEQPPYSYPPTAYETPPYGYAPPIYVPPVYETPYLEPRAEIVVNPVGIVRDVARLFRK